MRRTSTTKVYYNSACPVCDSGIQSQKEKMGTCDVEWIDVHSDPCSAEELGADLASVRERLHVKDSAGEVLVGAKAFELLWGMTPKQKILSKVAGWPIVRPLFDVSYNLFAKALYRWNRWRKHW